jgi:hypothetical protein
LALGCGSPAWSGDWTGLIGQNITFAYQTDNWCCGYTGAIEISNEPINRLLLTTPRWTLAARIERATDPQTLQRFGRESGFSSIPPIRQFHRRGECNHSRRANQHQRDRCHTF